MLTTAERLLSISREPKQFAACRYAGQDRIQDAPQATILDSPAYSLRPPLLCRAPPDRPDRHRFDKRAILMVQTQNVSFYLLWPLGCALSRVLYRERSDFHL